ncbi:MAG: DUF1553 domain-containing protein [Planctomycetaceae bacterium]|nr:MAG: DUF1553 domain-containing protein [Planctomycetaceae bacterium]
MDTGITGSGAPEFAADQLEFFEKRIRPLLVTHCFECHSGGAAKLQAGLRLDFRDAMLTGGDSGPAILPGNADDSLLIHSVRYESYEMPPSGKLSGEEIGWLVEWIEGGAAWPDEERPELADGPGEFDLESRKAAHWAWQPLAAHEPPTADWVMRSPETNGQAVQRLPWETIDPIDRFVARGLAGAGLAAAPPIDRRGLARRLHFDLIGLPPAPEVVEAYVADSSPDATERLVDELLSSPHFGERWGRHWLDLVRYAESRGHEFDHDAVNAYQYRDYVIRGFNADVPYDSWVTEHIAGDLLPDARLDPNTGANESILATGFWFLGEWVHSPVDTRKDESDRFDNMIDVFSKTFLGLTVACARCHDHKFDAITTADYYALSGYLQSSDFGQVRFETLESDRGIAERLAESDQHFRNELTSHLAAHGIRLVDAEESTGASDQPGVAGPSDVTQPAPEGRAGDPVVLIDYGKIGPNDFLQNGFLFGPGPARPGQLLPPDQTARSKDVDAAGALSGGLRVQGVSAALADPFWNGIRSATQGGAEHRGRLGAIPMAGRTLRSPTVMISDGAIACRVRGQGQVIACVDSHRLIAGPLHNETVQAVPASETWQWVRMNLGRYVGHRIHFEFVPDADSVLDVALVAQGPTNEWLAEYERREAEREAQAAEQQRRIDALAVEDSPTGERLRELIDGWITRRRELREQVRETSRLAMAMVDGAGVDDQILIRGNPSTPGQTVPRRFLSALGGEAGPPIGSGSGRLELAKRINDPENPLPHRVIVNRIWHHLLGRGLVSTTDDFGVLGQPPTHPELLDHLALGFLAEGRSIKRMIRRIVLTRTYQMSSHVDRDAFQTDPNNSLWHHREPRRLDGESLRDALLAISGRLDPSLGGEPIPIHLTSFMEGRGRPGQSGPLDGAGRRSIYISVRRNFISPFMLAFDTPVPFSTMGRRNVSNVPAQALILMNDPFVVEQAGLWAARVLAEPVAAPGSTTPESLAATRIDRMYRSAFARGPREEEVAAAFDFLGIGSGSGETGLTDDASRWADLTHALINTKEFLFLR